jgi:hypothetical protein
MRGGSGSFIIKYRGVEVGLLIPTQKYLVIGVAPSKSGALF